MNRMQTLQKPIATVAVVYRSVPQYRHGFYSRLRERLAEEGIELRLIYGQPAVLDARKRDSVELEWAMPVRNTIIPVLGRHLCWQPVLRHLRGTDLVIVEQASRLLVNYLLVCANVLRLKRVAFWGHGRNFQSPTASRSGEWLKRLVSSRVHWWFAYNNLSASVVFEMGFPPERTTVVQNAIDTSGLAAARAAISGQQLETVRRALGLKSPNVGIFIGGMYREKRLPFLLQACELVRGLVPDFELILVGAGPDDAVAVEANRRHSWVHYVGPRFDEDKVPFFALSKLLLMPGLVGLVVLDSFALGVPLVTTAVPYHSPEIEYLEDGVNGVVVKDPDSPSPYADAVVRLLRSDSERNRLIEGCRISAQRYTLEEMVDRFARGVLQALGVTTTS